MQSYLHTLSLSTLLILFVAVMVVWVVALRMIVSKSQTGTDKTKKVLRFTGNQPFTWELKKRMFLVWITTLIMFAFPRSTMSWGPIIHRPLFLIFVPILLACVSLFVTAKDVRRD
jgi:hypothetical protein